MISRLFGNLSWGEGSLALTLCDSVLTTVANFLSAAIQGQVCVLLSVLLSCVCGKTDPPSLLASALLLQSPVSFLTTRVRPRSGDKLPLFLWTDNVSLMGLTFSFPTRCREV